MQNRFDPSILNELREHIGNEAIARVIALFKSDVARRVSLLSGLPGGELSRAAHALKGSALEVGASALADAARDLEQSAATLSPSAIAERLAALDLLVADAFAALDEIAAQNP
jgi:HPt (histidine-containing phosphotransfer) domain-containing protein